MAERADGKHQVYGRRREGRWTPIRAKAQDTRANPNSWETHLVRKRWDIVFLRALSPRIMMMMMIRRPRRRRAVRWTCDRSEVYKASRRGTRKSRTGPWGT